MKNKDKPIPMTIEEEYRNADVPMPKEISSKDQEEYSGAIAYSEFLKLFFKGKK
tara:strand:+ start:499 stop:660 length:162 start_codon:yes stop_codon:yes gene_type:complete